MGLCGRESSKEVVFWLIYTLGFSDLPEIEVDDITTTPLLFIDTAGCDMHELDLAEEISKGNEGAIITSVDHCIPVIEIDISKNS